LADIDIAWLEYEINYNKYYHGVSKGKQFVLNKRCSKCGSKIYWIRAPNRYICQQCQDEEVIKNRKIRKQKNVL
jgi:ribosomal protein S27AE